MQLNIPQNDYTASFLRARSIGRHHHFYVGPTNSGKTYFALQALIQAESGVYLAPLRLLAMEIRDRLVAAGVPCNLITGEERHLIPGAQHTASTIEMMNPNKSVEIAIIDEIQMLQDPDRGSAWTAALVGVPAKQVFVCGSNAVTKPCLRVIEAMQETYEITHLARKTPLILEDNTLCGARYNKTKLKKQLQVGDAIVAFSRKDVLTFAARFRQWGFSVATIYGALAPEVRRIEAERFLNGQAQLLVATDAIGMGLNLPIRRVIFANIHKFDGVASRNLNATEARQIAGRAGRFGQYDIGYVNVMEDDERFHIAHMLATDDTVNLNKLPISLHFEQIANTAQKLFTNRIAECFAYLQDRQQFQDDLFLQADMSASYNQALLVDEHAPHMGLQDKYVFCIAPISLNLTIEKDYFLLCLTSVDTRKTRKLPPAPNWLSSDNPQYLEIAERLSQNISLYAWLSFKFPQIFIEGSAIKPLRTAVSHYISRMLQTQTGFGKTQREHDLLGQY